jgi:hypothetical protein
MKTVTEFGQNIIDLCLQCYGSLDSLFKLILDNNLGNLNVNLTQSQEVEFELHGGSNPDSAVQAFYQNRALRIKTGEVNYPPTPACGIPEGFVLFRFEIQNIAPDTVLYLNLSGGTCPTTMYLNSLTKSQQYAAIAFMSPPPNYSPTAAAIYFAQWYNQYQSTGFCHATNGTVSLFLPSTTYPCGTTIGICGYKKPFGQPNLFASLQPTIQYANNSKTICCGDASGVNAQEYVILTPSNV